MASHVTRKLAQLKDPQEKQRVVDEACDSDEACCLVGVALAGCDLSGLRLIGLHMRDVDLRGVCCRGAVFPELAGCVFDDVDARGAHFPRLEGCRFTGANLSGARLGGHISDCDFSGVSLIGARIGEARLLGGDERRASCFADADMRSVDAAGACLSGACLRNARLSDARLSRADLSGCDMRQTDLDRANLVCCRLEDVVLTDASFAECVVSPEQVSVIRSAAPQHGPSLRLAVCKAGPMTGRLVTELGVIGGYRIQWFVRSDRWGVAEKVMLTNRLTTGEIRGYAFESETSEFIRMYPLEGEGRLPSILSDIAADYAGWAHVSGSVDVEVDAHGGAGEIRAVIEGAIGEWARVERAFHG